ncbi:11391_t:CDS:1, partial [Diversispora eburnea]
IKNVEPVNNKFELLEINELVGDEPNYFFNTSVNNELEIFFDLPVNIKLEESKNQGYVLSSNENFITQLEAPPSLYQTKE